MLIAESALQRTIKNVILKKLRIHTHRATLALLLVAASTLVVNPLPVYAHSSVSGTTPTDGEVIVSSPTEFIMTFNEKVTVPDGFFRIVDALGDVRPLNGVSIAPKENGTVARVQLPANLTGWNALGWKAISSDGHEIEGTVTFTIGVSTALNNGANQSAVEKLNADPLSNWRRTATALRSISYLATLIAVGGLGFLWVIRRTQRQWAKRPEEDELKSDQDWFSDLGKPATRLVSWAAVIGAMSAPLALALNTYLLNGGSFDGIGTAFSIQVGTPVGLAQLIRVSAFFAFCTAALLIVDKSTKKFGVVIGVVAATALVVSYALSGHATIVKYDNIAAVALVVHLAAASLWAGGLPALALTLRKINGNPTAAGAVTDAFSRLATISVIILFPAAIALSITMFTTLSEVLETAYGLRLLGKFAVVVVIAAVGAYNHFVIIPKIREGREENIIASLKRTTGVEVLGVLAIVTATTLLTGQGAPAAGGSHVTHLGGASSQAQIDPTTSDVIENSRPVVARGVFGDGEIELSITPARASIENTVKIAFINQDGSSLQVNGPVKVKIFLPGSDLVPIEREAVRFEAGWQLKTSDFGFSGAWRVQVTASLSALNTPTGEATVAIRPAS